MQWLILSKTKLTEVLQSLVTTWASLQVVYLHLPTQPELQRSRQQYRQTKMTTWSAHKIQNLGIQTSTNRPKFSNSSCCKNRLFRELLRPTWSMLSAKNWKSLILSTGANASHRAVTAARVDSARTAGLWAGPPSVIVSKKDLAVSILCSH